MKPDGILGLNNNPNFTNIIDQGYKSGYLVSDKYAFSLGNR